MAREAKEICKSKSKRHDLVVINRFLTTFPIIALKKGIAFTDESGKYKLTVKESVSKFYEEEYVDDAGINSESWDVFKMEHWLTLTTPEKEYEINIHYSTQNNFWGRKMGPVIYTYVTTGNLGDGVFIDEKTRELLEILVRDERTDNRIATIIGD